MNVYIYRHVLCLVTQLCPTLWNSMDCSPTGFSVHGDSPGKNIEVGCHAFLQGIFPTQGLNPGLRHAGRFFTIWTTVKPIYRHTYILLHACSVTQLYPTLGDPMDCSLPGSSVHGIFHARILKWVAISSSKESSQPRDWTCIFYVSCIGRWVLYHQRYVGHPHNNHMWNK